MLEEPEQGIADDVVILVVCLRLRRHETQSELTRITKFNEFFTGVLCVRGALPISFSHGCSDPDRFVLAGDGGDRRDHATAPLARLERTVRLPRERYRSSIRGDNEGTRAKLRVQGRIGRYEPLCLVRGRAIWHSSSFGAESRLR